MPSVQTVDSTFNPADPTLTSIVFLDKCTQADKYTLQFLSNFGEIHALGFKRLDCSTQAMNPQMITAEWTMVIQMRV